MANRYSFFLDQKGNQINVGIHPRNWYMAKVPGFPERGEKQDTCARRNDNRKGTLAFREKARGDRRTAMAATMSKPANATSFRVPGSMRGW